MDVTVRRRDNGGIYLVSIVINAAGDTASYAYGPMPGTVLVDQFPGANDDAQLANALNYAAAQTYKPAILFGGRKYSYTKPITGFSGMRLVGTAGQVDQVRSGDPYPCAIYLSIGGSNGWLNFPNGNTYGIYVGGLTFNGNSTTRFAGVNSAANVVTSMFENLSFNGFQSVFGSTTTVQAFTISTFAGFWNVNNGTDTQFTLGGSDCSFWENSSINLDTPGGYRAAGSYLLNLASMSKTTIGPVYTTADRGSGVKISNSGVGQLIIRGARFEGRNAATPCYGSTLRIEGNTGVMLRDCWYGYGMTNPSATGRNDAGVIHVSGGDVEVNGATYGAANGISQSVPFLYAEGGKVRIRSVHTQTNQSWAGKPVVVQAGSAIVDADNSVTVKNGAGTIIQP